MSAMSTDGAPDDADIYHQYEPELIRYATILVGPDDAPDVVTDAVLAAIRSPAWRTVGQRRAYLYRAVLNTDMGLIVGTAVTFAA